MIRRLWQFLFLSILGLLLNGCIISGFVGVPGVSVGGFGFGLEGVSLHFINNQGTLTTTTNVDGYYSFENVETGTWKVIPEKEGYYFYPGSIEKTGYDSSLNLQEVNFLAIPVGPKTEWEGDFVLKTFEDLQTLSGYYSVKGELVIETTSLTDLVGLESLTYVGGLKIQNNLVLESLEGLNNLTIVGELGFNVTDNEALTNLNALSNLTNYYGEYILISRSSALTNIEGLSSCTANGYFMVILYENPLLTSISQVFDDVRSDVIEGHYTISTQADLDALSGYRAVSGELTISDTTLTTLAGLESLIYTGGLTICNNDFLTGFDGLNNLKTVGDVNIFNYYGFGSTLTINNNDTITNLHGMESLTSFTGWGASVSGNDSLFNFEGLNNLSKGTFMITISQNMALNSFDGLENIAPNAYFIIQGLNGIANFHGLEEVTHIRGIYLDGSNMLNFQGLNNLSEIGSGAFYVGGSSIQSFDGLENLRSIDGGFGVQFNHSLESMDALSNLESVWNLNISYNNNLTSLGLDNLFTVNGSFFVASNDNLCNHLASYLHSQIIGGEMRSYLNKDCTPDFYPPDPSVPEGMVRIPDLRGIMRYEAYDILEAGGLYEGYAAQYDNNVIINAVVDQTPTPGTIVEENSAVCLVLSLGPAPDTVCVPNVTGINVGQAQSNLIVSYLTVGTITEVYNETVQKNVVISQNPEKNTYAPFMSAVDMVVSLGPVTYTVPDLVDMEYQSAIAAITSAGFNVGTRHAEYHPTIPYPNVISQDPAAGTQALPGSSIQITYSLGPPTTSVPALYAKEVSEAIVLLEQSHLTIGNIFYEYTPYYIYYPEGTVFNTDPPYGTNLPYDSPVDLFVSLGPPE